MGQYTVYLPGGGSMRVNASSPQAALGNAGGGASLSPQAPAASRPAAAAPAPAAAAAPAGSSSGPLYNTVNGPRTADQMLKELVNVGWNGAGDITQVYARTTGGAVTPTGSSGTAAGGAAVPQTTAAGGLSLDPQSMAALTNFGNAVGTATAAELAERKRQFDLALEWQKQMWTQQGLPTLVIQQKAQQLAQDEFNFQSEMANKNLALQTAGVTGTFNGAPTEQAREFNAQNALAQQQLASDVLKTQASLQGPSNFVQAANYARGISQTDIPAFMTNLLRGSSTASTTGGIGLSAPVSLTNLAGQTGAGGGAVASNAGDVGRTLNLGRAVFSAGGGALGPQALEELSDTERGMLSSIGGAVGGDIPTFMNQYARTRIGQQALQAA